MTTETRENNRLRGMLQHLLNEVRRSTGARWSVPRQDGSATFDRFTPQDVEEELAIASADATDAEIESNQCLATRSGSFGIDQCEEPYGHGGRHVANGVSWGEDRAPLSPLPESRIEEMIAHWSQFPTSNASWTIDALRELLTLRQRMTRAEMLMGVRAMTTERINELKSLCAEAAKALDLNLNGCRADAYSAYGTLARLAPRLAAGVTELLDAIETPSADTGGGQ